ncbi:hypothetical protein [Nostoc sp. DSM 114167]|uniref:hypothetical protein n=1 Tax=Nostoc sp. DSM 114167 TaxID=3439050 RepID=UPI0040465AE2
MANTNSINGCNTSLGKDAMNRVSTNGLFVALFFQIDITMFPVNSLNVGTEIIKLLCF